MNILVIFKNKILRRFKKGLQLVKSSNIFYNSSIVVKKSCLSSNIVIGKNSKIHNSNLNFKGSIGNDTLINEAKIIGKLDSEEGCKFYKCELSGNIRIGKYTSLWGPNLDVYSGYQKVFIGNFCSIARNVSMQTYNHNMNKLTTYFIGQNLFKEKWTNERASKGNIKIKNDVWIGAHSVILGGVTINNGAIIAANSVVTNDVPAFSIVAGSPAKVIRYRFEKEVINRLEKLEWWNWSTEKIEKNKFLFEGEVTIDSLHKITN